MMEGRGQIKAIVTIAILLDLFSEKVGGKPLLPPIKLQAIILFQE